MSPLAIIATQLQFGAALQILEGDTTGVPDRFVWAARFVAQNRGAQVASLRAIVQELESASSASRRAVLDPQERGRALVAANRAKKASRGARARELASQGLSIRQVHERMNEDQWARDDALKRKRRHPLHRRTVEAYLSGFPRPTRTRSYE